jgi:hypothetical protein|tara:strand:- start:489 stop:668 length:180 start_codon:yes stop_codon:yes gene_type:complete
MTKVTLEALDATQNAHARRLNEVEHDVNIIKNRVHPWIVATMTGGGTVIGGLISHIVGG